MLTILVIADSDAAGADRLIRASELARRYWSEGHGLEGVPWPDAEALRAWATILPDMGDLSTRAAATDLDFSDPFFQNGPRAFCYYAKQRTGDVMTEVFFEASPVTAETAAYGIRTLVRVRRP